MCIRDRYSSSDKKEKRAKTKRVTRSSSVVIDLVEPSKEKKRDGRKRVRSTNFPMRYSFLFYFYDVVLNFGLDSWRGGRVVLRQEEKS